MSWIRKFFIKMAIRQLDQLKPLIADKIIEAQKDLSGVSPQGFAEELINELEDVLFTKAGITKGDR